MKLLRYRISYNSPERRVIVQSTPFPAIMSFAAVIIDRMIMLSQVSVNAKLFVIMDMNRLDVQRTA